jgi:hypothetical protein
MKERTSSYPTLPAKRHHRMLDWKSALRHAMIIHIKHRKGKQESSAPTMSTFEKITAARKVLDLPETASMSAIKARYRKMLTRWHPDKCHDNKDECAARTREIISAYRTVKQYCDNYQFSFSEDSVRRHMSPEERWFAQFGNDTVWGSGGEAEEAPD